MFLTCIISFVEISFIILFSKPFLISKFIISIISKLSKQLLIDFLSNRYSKNVLAQAIYSKDIREDAVATLEAFKY